MSNRERKGRILIIGAGGVATVAAHECAPLPDVFKAIMVASRTIGKCKAIKGAIRAKYGREIETAQIDADNTAETGAPYHAVQPGPGPRISPSRIRTYTSWTPAGDGHGLR